MFLTFVVYLKIKNIVSRCFDMMFSRHFTRVLLSATALSMLSACAIFDKKDTAEPSNWFMNMLEKDGQSDAQKASLAYLEGNFDKALTLTSDSLKANPRNQQALLVGALSAEKLGRYNKARQYYEDLIVIDGQETSILGTPNNQPQKISTTAKTRLRSLTISQTNLTIENKDGSKSFSISKQAGAQQSKQAINKALTKKSPAVAKKTNIDNLFPGNQQNIVSRFLILKELAEKDFITKEEFLSRRQANLGGLLPLTNKAPGVGIDQPVPSPELIIERLEILKDGVENRAITPREFSAERDVIIEALMSPNPRNRLKNQAPSKNILDAAKDLRRLEALYNMGLITDSEREKEKKAIEKYLGIKHDEPTATTSAPVLAPVNETAGVPAAPSAAVEAPAPLTVQVAVPEQVSVPVAVSVPEQIQIPATVTAPAPLQVPASVQVTPPAAFAAPAPTIPATAPQPAPALEAKENKLDTTTPDVSSPF